ncbi:division/cell wall cluster transcriptional repressor MraZ [Desulfothermobacter acidiphilus]|uniref:division/cell wall cluster transcriptional repressor MraZ n=1 Tax=Desulfothermobacter acidiphilus TaxID=1938353 RepID=UPI003F8B3613
MFIGTYVHTLDNKGRLFIPARLREGLGDSFVLTKGLEGCLFGFSREEWARLEERLLKLPFTQPEVRAFTRLFFAGAAEVEVDRQGRILLPPYLREYAHLERDVVVLGVTNRVEFWSQEEWEAYQLKTQAVYEDLAAKLITLPPAT